MWVDILNQGWFVGTRSLLLILYLHQESNVLCGLFWGRIDDGQNAWSCAAFHVPCWMQHGMEDLCGQKKTGWIAGTQHTEGLRTVLTTFPSSGLEDVGNGSTFLYPWGSWIWNLQRPVGALANWWPWRELSVPRVTGSLLSSPVPHGSFHTLLGEKYILLCLVLLSTLLFLSVLGGLC